MKQKPVILIIIFILLLSTFFLIFLKNKNERDEELDKTVGETLLEYRNEKYGYKLNYSTNWQVREKENFNYFHSLLSNKNLPITHVNWNTYLQGSSIIFSSFSDFTYIEGTREHQIEHHVYPNPHNLSISEWYNLFIITEALHSQRITEADFIRKSKNIIEKGEEIKEEDSLYDPWTPKGEIIKIDKKDVLKTTLPGDYRHNGYQYYILLFNNYFLVFKFGYGGATTNRDLWKSNNEDIIKMIRSIRPL